MDDQIKIKTIEHFFKADSISGPCLEPKEQCKASPIRAHSIPNKSVLSRLAYNGHLIAVQTELSVSLPSKFEFKQVGIKKASTFRGLCAQHDNDLFQIIDDKHPDTSDPYHLFLLAYRAVLKEFYSVMENAMRFQFAYNRRVEAGLSPKNEPDHFGMVATSHVANAYESYMFKRLFDDQYLASDWSKLKHHVIILEDQPPSLAVSSMFSLDDVIAPETPRITLNIFPMRSDVAIIFSIIPEDVPYADHYLQRVLTSKSYYQKYLLSKLVLQSCGNFVISPKYYDSMSEDKKAAISKFFIDTITRNIDDQEDERLYLF